MMSSQIFFTYSSSACKSVGERAQNETRQALQCLKQHTRAASAQHLQDGLPVGLVAELKVGLRLAFLVPEGQRDEDEKRGGCDAQGQAGRRRQKG
jgi:hypothetical protein